MSKFYTQDEVVRALQCKNWQSTRLAMKGTSTPFKLDRLKSYMNHDFSCCDYDTRAIQVVNYLNALVQGGFIESISWVQDRIDVEHALERIRVRK